MRARQPLLCGVVTAVCSAQEVEEYAQFLGMDTNDDFDKQLLWVVHEALKAPLPEDWKPCKTADGEVYYFK